MTPGIVDGLSALPATKFNFATDVLCVSIGCDVRLVRNVNVSAGLVNSATGTVVSVIYDNADCGQHPASNRYRQSSTVHSDS